MKCEKHDDIDRRVTKVEGEQEIIQGRVSSRIKWKIFMWIIGFIVFFLVGSYSRTEWVRITNAQEHKELTPRDDFKEFRQDMKEGMNEIKQLIREIK
ncbi:MAG: hypothetical protein ACXABY_19440 [Candidatus Thorarchaeota archaeon]|jgi:hypothetical protein